MTKAILPVGRYKGASVEDAPSGYLVHLLSTSAGLRKRTRDAIERELERRANEDVVEMEESESAKARGLTEDVVGRWYASLVRRWGEHLDASPVVRIVLADAKAKLLRLLEDAR
jgi:hypothetical protein